ncbi:alpha/beta hydrolase [Sphingobacterium sp. DK4209]|uniref:Alpha/beta hydrolase n=1 Tax=Sphingobacterium zhuxiongii TaxID=2662364 RepID=A0A5Q0QAT7_9SPHI|nr:MULTISPECIES: alpha/beta hydrolase-fold protein [unclassified Sphingobacterium]MVZ64687.1 alpha/beta hydrolase [Sphingobacterium sp. DK4209]QGA27025.1 alpha/beta hydrolase [Sphingobacterium sp. dk4302]
MTKHYYPLHLHIVNQNEQHVGEQVYLAGTFNNWSEEHLLLGTIPEKGKRLDFILPELRAAEHEFKLSRGNFKTLFATPSGQLAQTVWLNHSKESNLEITIEAWRDDFPASTAGKQVTILDEHFYFPSLNVHRKIMIYLPKGYRQSEQRYPVLYMHDGQHLFDEATSVGRSGPVEWQVDKTIDKSAHEAIVVAIYHAANYELRAQEYMLSATEEIKNPKGLLYLEDIVQELKPFIDDQYRTYPDAANTAIAGSSIGGLISIYAGLLYPDVFGTIGSFSPSIWMDEEALYLKTLNKLLKYATEYSNQTLYFYVGGKEKRFDNKTSENDMKKELEKYIDFLAKNYKGSIELDINEHGKHGAAYWQLAFPRFFEHWNLNMGKNI